MEEKNLIKILIFLFILFLLMPFIKFFVFHFLGWHMGGCGCRRYF